MIKPVDEIPQTLQEKRKTYRAMIRADIQAAIDSGVQKFEFVGDAYNYKYLTHYAREEADNMTDKALRPLLQAAAQEHGWNYLKPWRIRRSGRYIKITSHKAADRMHVFCEIRPDALPEIVAEAVKQEIEGRKRYEENQKRRAEREGKQ